MNQHLGSYTCTWIRIFCKTCKMERLACTTDVGNAPLMIVGGRVCNVHTPSWACRQLSEMISRTVEEPHKSRQSFPTHCLETSSQVTHSKIEPKLDKYTKVLWSHMGYILLSYSFPKRCLLAPRSDQRENQDVIAFKQI